MNCDATATLLVAGQQPHHCWVAFFLLLLVGDNAFDSFSSMAPICKRSSKSLRGLASSEKPHLGVAWVVKQAVKQILGVNLEFF